jgi:hypothetical protein
MKSAMCFAFLVSLSVVGVVTPVAAQQNDAIGKPPAVSKPFRKLFAVRPTTPFGQSVRSPAAGQASTDTPKVVCGLSMTEVDPRFDAQIRQPITTPGNQDFKIRRITPPVCR